MHERTVCVCVCVCFVSDQLHAQAAVLLIKKPGAPQRHCGRFVIEKNLSASARFRVPYLAARSLVM